MNILKILVGSYIYIVRNSARPFQEHEKARQSYFLRQRIVATIEMAGQQQQDKKIGFKTITLYKEQTLGIGAYGAVCMAKCDDLLCAAKIIHPTLFDPTALHQIAPHREHRLPIRRFQLECDFLSTIRHPNIVQYLGTHQDPDTGLPVLLMELMDDSLTGFLESSTQPIPYHIQVNICHDITLALSFLHSNDIVHRDLSSNNVLLIGNNRAKLTDFGMARLGDLNLHATRITNTMCPGTDVYMPPETVQDKPVYTEKIDCFSFGVIIVQILTREFPKPGDRQMTIDDPRYPRGALKLCVPEIKRRQNHISQVDPNHPLLPIVLDCLKDRDIERPSAQQLCERVVALKETSKYKIAHERANDSSDKDEEHEQIQSLQQTLEEKNHVIDQKDAMIAEREQQLRQCREELSQQIQQLERDKQRLQRERNDEIQEKVEEMRQLGRVNQQLEESERPIADSGKRNTKQLHVRNQAQAQDVGDNARAVNRANIKLGWREGEKALCKMSRICDAVLDNNTVYYRNDGDNYIYAYYMPTSYWSIIPDCPLTGGFAITVIDGVLTTVGGFDYDTNNTNKLFSLTGQDSRRKWTKKFPPMPTKRFSAAALCTGTALIVAGGADDSCKRLKAVEVLNTETKQWHTVPDLPEPLMSSLTLCGDLVYLLGGSKKPTDGTHSVYSCLLNSLLLSAGSMSLVSTPTRSIRGSIWNRVADLPVTCSTGVTLHGQLLAIGGRDSDNKPTTAVHMYQPTTNSWETISHMTTPRYHCLAAVLPDNQLMVVGGKATTNKTYDSVEFGRAI